MLVDTAIFIDKEDIDCLVMEEIPERERFPRTHNTVVEPMVHVPSSKRNP
jgi:hypothetical protein